MSFQTISSISYDFTTEDPVLYLPTYAAAIDVEIYSPWHSSHFLPVMKEQQWHTSSSILLDAQVPPRHGRPKQGSCNHNLTFQEEGRHEELKQCLILRVVLQTLCSVGGNVCSIE